MGARLESRSHKDRESAGRAKAAYQRRFTPEGAHQVRRSDRGMQRDTEMGLPRKLVRAAAMFFLWERLSSRDSAVAAKAALAKSAHRG